MIWHIVLAHFSADYLFQNGWMVRNKQRLAVLLLHVSIHLVTMLVLVGKLRQIAWPYLLALTLAHFCIDLSKNIVNRIRPRWVIVPYIVDQVLHYITIAAMITWFRATQPGASTDLLPFSPTWAILGIAYLVSTYVWFISERILVYADESYRRDVQNNFMSRLAVRAGLLTVMLAVVGYPLRLFQSGISLAGLFFYRGKYGRRALLTDLGISFLAAFFVYLVGI